MTTVIISGPDDSDDDDECEALASHPLSPDELHLREWLLTRGVSMGGGCLTCTS
jgi:hypothetical protein